MKTKSYPRMESTTEVNEVNKGPKHRRATTPSGHALQRGSTGVPLRYLRALLFNLVGPIVLTLAAVITLLPAAAQAQAIEAWLQRYHGPGNDHDLATSLAVDASGNVCVTGQSSVFDGPADYATLKYSPAGVPLWTNRFDGGAIGGDSAVALTLDSNGNVLVTGHSDSGGNGYDYVTIKYSSAGVPLWTNRYDGPASNVDLPKAMAVGAEDNVYVTGCSYNSGTQNPDYATIAYSAAGTPLWTHRYHGLGYGGIAWSVAVDAGGNVFVTGTCAENNAPPYNYDFVTIKYSSAGIPLWTNRYNGPANDDDDVYAMVVDKMGSAIITGWSYGDYATIKYSNEGVPLWTNWYNGPGNSDDCPYAVAADASGDVYVTGFSAGSGGNNDYATIAYSSTGMPLWTNRYNGPGNGADSPVAIAVDASGNVHVTGFSGGGGSWNDYATITYSGAGVPLWTNRYNGPGNSDDRATAIAVDGRVNVYVTGKSWGTAGYWEYATVKYVMPLIFTLQPLSRTNAVGTTAGFSVEAVGGLPLSYQWRRDGTNLLDGGNLSGVTTTNLLIANVQSGDAAGYTVVVTNAHGSATSSVAQLTVIVSPGRFTRLAYSPETGFSFIFHDATVGRPYRIQISPSLAPDSWVDWMSFNYTAPVGFMDLGAVEATNIFYRAVSP